MSRISTGLLGLCLTLTACDGGDDTGATDTMTDCQNSVTEFFPADGETQAYYRTTVEVNFAEFEEDATLTVADADGNDVSGTHEWFDDRLVFTPDSALSPSTSYTTTVLYSCSMDGSLTATWQTGEVGTSVDLNSTDLEGRTYLLNLKDGRFVEPEGVGDVVGDFLDQIVFVGVNSASSTEIEMMGGLGYKNTDDAGDANDGLTPIADPGKTSSEDSLFQEPCLPTIEFPEPADFTGNPFFEVVADGADITVAGYTVTVDELQVSGAFSPDGSYIAGASLAGRIDTEPLVPLLFEGCDEPELEDGSPNPDYPCDPAAVCDTVAFITECEPCEVGGAESDEWCGPENGYDENGDPQGEIGDKCCLSLLVDSMTAEQVVYEADDSTFTLEAYSDPADTDATTETYCDANPSVCGSLEECSQ